MLKRKIRKALIITALIIVAIFIVMPLAMACGVKYVKVSERTISQTMALPDDIQAKLNAKAHKATVKSGKTWGETMALLTNEEICDYLSYSIINDVENGRANSVGYPQVFANAYNSLVASFDSHPETYANVANGYIYWYGINLIEACTTVIPNERAKAFVRDEAFVELHETIDGKDSVTFFSPCIDDFCFPISCLSNI